MVLAATVAACAPKAAPPPPQSSSDRPLAVPRDLPGLPNFAQVSRALYRGAQPDRVGFQRLQQMGVKTIVDLRGERHSDELDGFAFRAVQIP